MKIVIAPNAFKGSLTAMEAADHIAHGVRKALPSSDIARIPLSDGGDGLIDVLTDAVQGEIKTCQVSGPLGNPMKARYCWVEEKRLAVIEMAEASGLMRMEKQDRDPLQTTTRGTGELMADALKRNAKKLVIGIGGSATNDGGTGMAAALGARFLDGDGRPIDPSGGTLHRIERIQMNEMKNRLESIEVEVICDVDNPLLGPEGASRVYAPQKGASPDDVDRLEEGMRHLAKVVKRELGKEMDSLPGGGAAGGLGAGLFAFAGGSLKPGADVVLELLDVAHAVEGVDLVITGEGCLDGQTLSGKLPARVAALAQEKGVACVALAGLVEGDEKLFFEAGFTRLYALCAKGESREESMKEARQRITDAAERAATDYFFRRK